MWNLLIISLHLKDFQAATTILKTKFKQNVICLCKKLLKKLLKLKIALKEGRMLLIWCNKKEKINFLKDRTFFKRWTQKWIQWWTFYQDRKVKILCCSKLLNKVLLRSRNNRQILDKDLGWWSKNNLKDWHLLCQILWKSQELIRLLRNLLLSERIKDKIEVKTLKIKFKIYKLKLKIF